jgi:flagellar protein FlaG
VDLEAGLRKIEDIVQKMNDEMKSTQRGLSFAFDRAISTHVVTVKSAESGEVIRQIPTEAVVRVAHNIEKLKGLMFDGKY